MQKRLVALHGGFKDGDTFITDPALFQSNKSTFLAQADIIALRTGRAVTRNASGYVTPAITVGQRVMGLIAFGFLDRLETREGANATMTQIGEGLTVLTGRFGTVLDTDMFSDVTGMVAGSKIYVAPAAGGKLSTVSTGAVQEIGWVSKIESDGIYVEINL